MSNRLPIKDRMKDHPMFAAENCDRCGCPTDCLNDTGTSGKWEFVCTPCLVKIKEEST